ncbi:MAG: RNA polymerase factor sigma-54 [Deltaproteobacteria bacterium]|nr:RNA polymerase factor sigma-54 [Deltaproteobacteria bacterium]
MVFELKQTLKLTQQLIMTPQLQQSIKLLQLSRLELADTINQELEENPLLEESREVGTGDDPETEIVPELDDMKVETKTREITGEGDGKEDFDWDGYLEDFGPMGVPYHREDADAPPFENMLTKTSSLSDHLLWQLNLSRFTNVEKRVGVQIIGNLNSDGYLMATPEEIAFIEDVEPTLAEDVLKKVQEFDPQGIATRDLKECLLTQIRLLDGDLSLPAIIVENHLKDLETRNYNNIARKLKVSIDDVQQAALVIIKLNPKPGLLYNEERAQYIIPDVFVFKVGDVYRIILNDDGLPKLRISNFYKKIMGGTKNNGGEKCKTYIKDKLQSATWLIKSIQQRQKTIYRVSESIVEHQMEFFDRGISYLKPMVLRDIADDVEMHESTISRVTTNKYMHTPRGIFELKYFFNSGINRIGELQIASQSVKEKIKDIVSGEDSRKPYNDSQIVDILTGFDISIARRTVAKYREMLGILPSSKRKKYF